MLPCLCWKLGWDSSLLERQCSRVEEIVSFYIEWRQLEKRWEGILYSASELYQSFYPLFWGERIMEIRYMCGCVHLPSYVLWCMAGTCRSFSSCTCNMVNCENDLCYIPVWVTSARLFWNFPMLCFTVVPVGFVDKKSVHVSGMCVCLFLLWHCFIFYLYCCWCRMDSLHFIWLPKVTMWSVSSISCSTKPLLMMSHWITWLPFMLLHTVATIGSLNFCWTREQIQMLVLW